MTDVQTRPTYRRYRDGDTSHLPWDRDIIQRGESHLCPTYVHRTPPCQGSCPSGHDIRGWLSIARGLDEPPKGDMPWQHHAFLRMAEANPFPAIMGRVCPAPCQDGCNRNEVDEHVGINAVEQHVGDWALANGVALPGAGPDTGKRVAVVGGGPAGLAAAYFLRRRGHGCTVFEAGSGLGGMMRFGIPGYRTPRDVLDGEIRRILDMGGIDVKLNTKVGVDVTLDEIETSFDAVFWAIGAQSGKPLPIPGAEAPNCVDGISFLKAFNEGRLQHLSGRILVIGGGDTAMDVAAVARRIGHIHHVSEKDRPENVILGQTVHDVAHVARRQGADVWIVYRRPISKAPASRHELDAVRSEGVEIHDGLAPLEVVRDADGRARALKVVPVDWEDGTMFTRDGDEYEIDCTLIVGATGQAGDFTGIEALNNGWGLMNADKTFQLSARPGHFAAGDVLKPHLLTTAIGQASIAVESIENHLGGQEPGTRPKVDKHHFDLLDELRAHDLSPADYDHHETWGTDTAAFAVHNYENRAFAEIIPHEKLFLGHFPAEPMNRRSEVEIDRNAVLGNFEERFTGLDGEQTRAEANRCLSCGMCVECDNCLIYCPQDAVHRLPKDKRAIARYVDTDYFKCVGCHICMDVCPTGYIMMGLGNEAG